MIEIPSNTSVDFQFQGKRGSINGQYGDRVKDFETNAIYNHSGTDVHSPESIKAIL